MNKLRQFKGINILAVFVVVAIVSTAVGSTTLWLSRTNNHITINGNTFFWNGSAAINLIEFRNTSIYANSSYNTSRYTLKYIDGENTTTVVKFINNTMPEGFSINVWWSQLGTTPETPWTIIPLSGATLVKGATYEVVFNYIAENGLIPQSFDTQIEMVMG
jgi:hypothetical protein